MRLHDAVFHVYDGLLQNGKPKDDFEFTVLASVVLSVDASVAGIFSDLSAVVSLATGTRSASLSVVDAPGRLMKDCHAEVLAKRAFNLFILDTLAIIDRQPDFENDILCILCKQSICDGLPQYSVKPGYTFHIFISDSPCGDSCIYKQSDGTIAFTGAKLVSPKPSCEIIDKGSDVPYDSISLLGGLPCTRESGEQAVGCLRLKPGRSDIADRSASMSCSDKLARWSVLGLQGKLLSSVVGMIYLSSISVGLDPLACNAEEQLSALRRSLVDRISGIPHAPMSPSLHIIDVGDRFPHGKQAMLTNYQLRQQANKNLEGETQQPKKRKKKDVFPCSTSINCVLDLSVYLQCSNRQKLLSEGLPRKCYNNNVEILIGNEGLPQGCTLASSVEKFSRLSRLSMRCRLDERIGTLGNQASLDTEHYQPWKRNQITVLGSQPSHSRYREYLEKETAFFQHERFKNWVRSSSSCVANNS
eukprot:gene38680-47024_t